METYKNPTCSGQDCGFSRYDLMCFQLGVTAAKQTPPLTSLGWDSTKGKGGFK